MISGRPGPHSLQGLPTLTEVVDAPLRQRPLDVDDQNAAIVPTLDGAATEAALSGAVPGEFNEQRLVQAVLNDLQRHADLMLEQRLREAMSPVLARLGDKLIDELRQELAATLRDLVARAVSQEVARLRAG